MEHIPAAPVMPGEPATTRTAEFHLWAVRFRAGSSSSMSPSVIAPTRAPSTGRPMSTTVTGPANAGPSAWTRPGFRAAKVTVAVAGNGAPEATPESPSMPDGMSTASTGVPDATVGDRYSPRKPVPNAASMTRSAGPISCGAPETSITVTRAPRRRSIEAATRPSAPLFPFPATTTIRRP